MQPRRLPQPPEFAARGLRLWPLSRLSPVRRAGAISAHAASEPELLGLLVASSAAVGCFSFLFELPPLLPDALTVAAAELFDFPGAIGFARTLPDSFLS